jgi:hypothetical protein
MVGTWRGKLPAHGNIFAESMLGVTRLRPLREVVVRELQDTASYMVDTPQQAKLERQVRSGRNTKDCKYVARLRGRSAIVVLVFVGTMWEGPEN